jgi:hypothetical protein
MVFSCVRVDNNGIEYHHSFGIINGVMYGYGIRLKSRCIPLFVEDIGITDIGKNIPIQVVSLIRVIGKVFHPLGIPDQVRPEVKGFPCFFIMEIYFEIDDITGLIDGIITEISCIILSHIRLYIFDQGSDSQADFLFVFGSKGRLMPVWLCERTSF